MEFLLFIILISFTLGFLWGRHTTKAAFTKVFKRFTDEMHRQYLLCLKAKGIQIKPDVQFDDSSHDKTRIAS